MRRLISDLCFAAAIMLGVVCVAQAQFNRFPPGVFNNKAALDPAPGGGGGSVTLDICGTQNRSAGGQTSLNYTGITIGTGNALVVAAQFDLLSVTGVTFVWDSGGTNQSMALIVSQDAALGTRGKAQLWGLINPTAGNKTLAIGWTTATQVFLNACSWNGVNAAGGATSFPNSAGGTTTGTTPSITITSAANHAVMASFANASGDNFSSANCGGSCTQVQLDNGGNNITVAADRASGAATVAMSAVSTNAGDVQSFVGTDISP